MAGFEEQCMCIMFCFRLGKIATENFEMLKLAFRDGTLSRT
jgi:hypothetical protein